MFRWERTVIKVGRGSLCRRIGRIGVVMVTAVAALFALSGPAMAEGKWSNHQTTLIIRDSGRYVGTAQVAISVGSQKASYRGRIFGPGFDVTTQSEYLSWATYRGYVNVNRVLPVGSRVCAEGFRYDGQNWVSIGLPCVMITES
jgi:hypothetical protein